MTEQVIEPQSRLKTQLDRAVRSAALAAECACATIYLKSDRPTVEPIAGYGELLAGCSLDAYNGLVERVAGPSGGLLIINDLLAEASGPARALCVTERPGAVRFAACVTICDETGEPIGLLVVTDARPRPGLSAAKAYVLQAMASQIADCLALERLQTKGAPQTHERLRLLESVVVHAKDSILITEAEPFDLPGPRIVYCNAAFTEATGYSAQEVLGQTPRILQGPDTDPASRAKIRASLNQWKPIEIEILNYRKNGTAFWVELSIVPVADETGWYTHWVSVQRDITHRKAAIETETRARIAEASNAALQTLTNELRTALDAAEAANVAKSQFLANMSHEIRTPLNGVLGMTQALWIDDLTPVQRERLAIIRESGTALLAVLNDVLDLSKIEAGRLEIEIVEFDLDELIGGVCGAFTEPANRAGVSFGLTVAEEAHGLWLGDSVRLRQVLYNLVSNAVKFTSQGEVHVHVELNDRGALCIRVRDTGIGIPDDKLESLFSNFYQGDNSITRRYGGTGLGLSICRQLCELMDGAIDVQTQAGRGSTFTVTLPIQRVATAPGVSRPESLAAPEPDYISGGHLRVLVAEDNRANQLVLRALLQAFDITPVVVENGRLATEAWEAERFDIVLMDVQMPEMDGVTATRWIRRREAETGRIPTPIVAVSANAMTHQVQDYLAAGMDGHLPKPMDITQLAETLSRLGPSPAENDAEGHDLLATA